MTNNQINGREVSFCQYTWHGIAFTSLDIELSRRNVASTKFYQEFYRLFFDKYSDYNDLSPSWRHNKADTARALASHILPNSRVLSYGCGIGFIEKNLSESRQDMDLTAYDFAETASHWIKRESQGFRFTTNLEGKEPYDVIFLCQVLYALDDEACTRLLEGLLPLLKTNGTVILVNSSLVPEENGLDAQSETGNYRKLLRCLKNLLRPMYYFLLDFTGVRKYQLWGWSRDNARVAWICNEAGYQVHQIFSNASQSFFILTRKMDEKANS